MKLSIEYYKNIRKLDIEFVQNKVNFIYGISGSGKSSICDAIIDKNPLDHLTFGANTSKQKIMIYPSINEEDIDIFNDENKSLFLNDTNKDEMYQILFSNGNEVENVYDLLMDELKEINGIKPYLTNYLNNINKLKKEIDLKSNAKKIDGTKNALTGLEIEMNSTDYIKNYNLIKLYGKDNIEWVKEGISFNQYEMGKCPFCHRKLSDYRKNIINRINEIPLKNYKLITSSNTYINVFKMQEPDYTSKRDVAKSKKELQKLLNTEIEVNELLNNLDNLNVVDLFNEKLINSIKLSDILKEKLPEIVPIIENFNSNYNDIKNRVAKISIKTKDLISNNLKLLNKYIQLLGIPYKFYVPKYNNSIKEINAYLTHNDNSKIEDNRKCLSYGEINIIALLLFIVGSKKDYVIIDDPASSFDENRKAIIYSFIMELLKDKTCIVLSHNQSFAKNAVIDQKINNKNNTNNIGCNYFISNVDNRLCVEQIKIEDFDKVYNHIKKYILNNTMSYFQKIINLRFLIEISRENRNKDDGCIYKYLSEIMHNKSKKKILKTIGKQYSEEDVLNLILTKFDVSLEPIPDDIFYDFNLGNLTLFEKVAYAREKLNKNSNNYKLIDKYAKDILSEIVHLSDTNISALNPYKYSIYSQNVIDIVNNLI